MSRAPRKRRSRRRPEPGSAARKTEPGASPTPSPVSWRPLAAGILMVAACGVLLGWWLDFWENAGIPAFLLLVLLDGAYLLGGAQRLGLSALARPRFLVAALLSGLFLGGLFWNGGGGLPGRAELETQASWKGTLEFDPASRPELGEALLQISLPASVGELSDGWGVAVFSGKEALPAWVVGEARKGLLLVHLRRGRPVEPSLTVLLGSFASPLGGDPELVENPEKPYQQALRSLSWRPEQESASNPALLGQAWMELRLEPYPDLTSAYFWGPLALDLPDSLGTDASLVSVLDAGDSTLECRALLQTDRGDSWPMEEESFWTGSSGNWALQVQHLDSLAGGKPLGVGLSARFPLEKDPSAIPNALTCRLDAVFLLDGPVLLGAWAGPGSSKLATPDA